MKGLHFARFYALFFIAACVFIYSFNQVYLHYLAPETDYSLYVEQVFSASKLPTFSTINASDIALSPELNTLLSNGNIVSYQVGSDVYFLKQIGSEQLQQWGPVNSQSQQNPGNLLFIFYMALAVLFLFLMRPLFRDIHHLQQSAIRFGQNPCHQPLTIKSNSSVYPLAEALYTMSNQLLEHIAQQKDLANIVAHEVRTPLARMKFVLQQIHHLIPEKQLERFNTDIQELEVLAHDYLEFGRSQRTDKDYLNQVEIRELIDQLSAKFAQLDTKVSFVTTQPDLVVFCNTAQLLLAITNLVNNALRYADTAIVVEWTASADILDISVIDDGPGFKHIKESTDSIKGFGLGLYIVRKVAERHSGHFSITRTPSQKTCVTISFPLNRKTYKDN